MKISHRGIIALEGREGIRLTVYRDSKGLATVGCGHLVVPADNLKVGDKITQARCDELFDFDLDRFENVVNNSVRGVKSFLQNEFDACVSLAFNIGESGFAHSSVVRCLNANDKAGAAAAFMKWVKPVEITGRRRSEVKQFLTPYPDSPTTSTPGINGPVPSRPLLKKGATGQDVKDLQKALGIPADGLFGEGTESAVKKFQKQHSLGADGIVGLKTWNALLGGV